MKAIQYSKLGTPDVLQYVDVEDPTIDNDQVLVKVAFASINHTDIHFRRGLPGVKTPLPHIPGCDASGTVQEIGKNVTHVSVGDKVYLNPTIYCGTCEFCQRGEHYLCKYQQLIGRESNGTYAELVAVPAKNVFKLPEGFDMSLTAAAPLVYQTAYAMVVTKARLKKGETILVMGAGSGVSMAAIQIAKHIGATVITTASTCQKCQKATDLLQADQVIEYTTESIKDRIKEMTNKSGVDVIIDHVGGRQWGTLIQSLKNGGRLVTCGATDGYTPEIDLRHVFFRQLNIMGSTMASEEDFLSVMQLIFDGHITPIIDQIFLLDDAASAHQYIEDRNVFGKVLLTP